MVFKELLSQLKYLGSIEQYDKQSALAMELFICMLLRSDLQKPTLLQMAINLWNLSQKNGNIDPKLKVSFILKLHYFIITLLFILLYFS